MHHGGSFQTYMQHKIIKLNEQFESNQLQKEQISPVFAGKCNSHMFMPTCNMSVLQYVGESVCTPPLLTHQTFSSHQVHTSINCQGCWCPAGVAIHVNGLTVPSHQELKQIMALHGGRFETYYHRSRVTHIICSNLPDTKLKQLAHARSAGSLIQHWPATLSVMGHYVRVVIIIDRWAKPTLIQAMRLPYSQCSHAR